MGKFDGGYMAKQSKGRFPPCGIYRTERKFLLSFDTYSQLIGLKRKENSAKWKTALRHHKFQCHTGEFCSFFFVLFSQPAYHRITANY